LTRLKQKIESEGKKARDGIRGIWSTSPTGSVEKQSEERRKGIKEKK
jgi:hypothetical protein